MGLRGLLCLDFAISLSGETDAGEHSERRNDCCDVNNDDIDDDRSRGNEGREDLMVCMVVEKASLLPVIIVKTNEKDAIAIMFCIVDVIFFVLTNPCETKVQGKKKDRGHFSMVVIDLIANSG